MILWVLMVMGAGNLGLSIYFFSMALRFSQAGEYALCGAYLLLTAFNGGLGTFVLAKLLK